jgi:ferrous iron transport protein B
MSLALEPRAVRGVTPTGRRRAAIRGTQRTPARVVALLGNPNTGKSTLFNALTGLRQKVANYPGVTVEKKIGTCALPDGRHVELLDLPGSYSLQPVSPDEVIVRDVLLGLQPDTRAPDLVVLVLDVTHLDRHLYLALQVIELGIPVVLALNMMDVAAAHGITVDEPALERLLGAPVVGISATTGRGLERLRALVGADVGTAAPRARHWPAHVRRAIERLEARLPREPERPARGRESFALALLLDGAPDDPLSRFVDPGVMRVAAGLRERLDEAHPRWRDELIEARYHAIRELLARVCPAATPPRRARGERVDRFVTHRVLGPVIFLVVMGVMFQSVFTWAQPAMNAIDLLVTGLGAWVGGALPAGPIRSLLVDGVIAGVGTAVTFVPQIAVLFLFLALLEDSGYMARAAFIMDRLMGKAGLSGRAFIPLLSSFACAIPGIMAARTIDNRRDRLTTIVVAPFMSCSARLPVYALLIGAFVPNRRLGFMTLPGLTLLSMYVLGILAAIVVAAVLKRTVLRGGQPLYVMELPPYRLPSWRSVALTVWDRALLFLRKAGTVILAVSIVLWFLASYPKSPAAPALGARIAAAEQRGDAVAAARLHNDLAAVSLRHSFAGRIGQAIEPAIRPLGFDWRIGIGLVTSLAAREVMVSTMATVFHLGSADDHPASLRETLRRTVDPATGRRLYTPLVAVSLMVFFVLACQCMSTLAVARRETNSWRWPLFMLAMMNAFAWVVSFAVFQGGRLLGMG